MNMFDKLENLERILYCVENARDELNRAEKFLDEDVVSKELEDEIVEVNEELKKNLNSLKRRMEEL